MSEGSILALNCGSSTVKHALFIAQGPLERGTVRIAPQTAAPDHASAVAAVLAGLPREGAVLSAVVHRVVHGGPSLMRPAFVDEGLLAALTEAIRFAPLHLPAEIAAVRAVSARYPTLPQVVCFDTYFHRTLPETATHYPLPVSLFDRGVRRYGFHGLSYEHVVEALGADLGERAVIAHLGSGASLAAVWRGASVDTTMGFSPTGGLVMGTRTGDLDPGLLLHLLANEGYDAAGLETLVNRESGLLALSETTSDVRALLAKEADDPRAALALDVFCRQIEKGIAAFAAVLGGMDHLVFTGGIGEGSAVLRDRICTKLGFLGIAPPGAVPGRCRVSVVAADEERIMVGHARALLQKGRQKASPVRKA